MADELPDFEVNEAVEAWLVKQPREFVVLFAARAALRVFPLLSRSGWRSDLLPVVVLPSARVNSVSWQFCAFSHDTKFARAASDADTHAFAARNGPDAADEVDDEAAAAAAAAASFASEAATVDSLFTDAAAQEAAVAAAHNAAGAAEVAVLAARKAAFAADVVVLATRADAEAFDTGSKIQAIARRPLWAAEVPGFAKSSWSDLKSRMLEANEGWEVWIDWYEARLRGDPVDWDLERQRALIPDEIWKAGPKAVNAEIAKLYLDAAAEAPQGRTLGLGANSGRIEATPAQPEKPDELRNAVDLVEEALELLRVPRLGNVAQALEHELAKLDIALTRHRDNPLGLHDRFSNVALGINAQIQADDYLDEPAVRDLRDACAQAVMDIRISVSAVDAMAKDRARRNATRVSQKTLTKVRRLLAESGEAFAPSVSEGLVEDVESVEASTVAEGEKLPEGEARDAQIRLATTLAWVWRFTRMKPDQVAAAALAAGRAVDEIERLIGMLRSAEDFWAVAELALRSF